MPNPPAKVRTNDTPNSKKSVQLRALSFQALWNAYPKNDPYDDPLANMRINAPFA